MDTEFTLWVKALERYGIIRIYDFHGEIIIWWFEV